MKDKPRHASLYSTLTTVGLVSEVLNLIKIEEEYLKNVSQAINIQVKN